MKGKIEIPESVTSIGNKAFNETKIDSIYLGAGINNIGATPFLNCNSLTYIEADFTNWGTCHYSGFGNTSTPCTFVCSEDLPNASAGILSTNYTIKKLKHGDVSRNDEINVNDISTLVEKLNTKTATSHDFKTADMDSNGVINLLDIQAIANKVIAKRENN